MVVGDDKVLRIGVIEFSSSNGNQAIAIMPTQPEFEYLLRPLEAPV